LNRRRLRSLLHLLPLLHLLALFYLPLLIHLPLLLLLALLIQLLSLLHLLALLQVLPLNLALLFNLTLLLHRPALNLRPILHRRAYEGIRPRTVLLHLPRPEPEPLATVLTRRGRRCLRRHRRQSAMPQRALTLSPTPSVTRCGRRRHHRGGTRLLLDRRP
jgi:hypothetical protein